MKKFLLEFMLFLLGGFAFGAGIKMCYLWWGDFPNIIDAVIISLLGLVTVVKYGLATIRFLSKD